MKIQILLFETFFILLNINHEDKIFLFMLCFYVMKFMQLLAPTFRVTDASMKILFSYENFLRLILVTKVT